MTRLSPFALPTRRFATASPHRGDNRRERRTSGDDEDCAFIVFPTALSIRDGGVCKTDRAGFDSREGR